MEFIVKTPLVRLEKIESLFHINNKLFAKVESYNPTGSIKDRAVVNMLLNFKKTMDLNGATIIEPTSGNTGISLAYFSKLFGYRAIIVMPKSVSKERREFIKKYNGELCLIDGGMKECQNKVNELLKSIPNSVTLDQFSNEANYKAHYKTTGPELLEQLNRIDYLFAGFGTGGTVSGIGKYFKEKKTNTNIIGIEPEESPLISKGYASSHLIQGIGANFKPDNLKLEYVDEINTVNSKESIEMAKTIRSVEQLDIGISSGAALLGAINKIKKENITNKNIVIIFPDKGDRYSW